ncbi:hypothetical protein [Clostridium estertheticum]|uniref:hypothetical protein n=1 Tax=Clostridium estertheticum TaxID=238834 RepID=UPI001CF3BB58|nr:hypothetical protein [Clostridium estertheticum]MCB2347879.1 hypothetical protein [Clostridium estertheticum]
MASVPVISNVYPTTRIGTIKYNSTIDLNTSIDIRLKELSTSITVSSVMAAVSLHD